MPVKPGSARIAETAEVELGERLMNPESPIIRCRVIYLGNNRNRSVALRGQVQIRKVQIGFDDKGEALFEEQKSAIDEGTQNYDFSSHDSIGRLISERLMPAGPGIKPEYVGKPFAFSEHIDHIRHFYEAKTADGQPEFKVLANREDQPIIQDYVRRFFSARQKDEEFADQVASR